MKKKFLYGIWIFLYVLCAAAGFADREQTTLQQVASMILAGLFFVPPVVLLVDAFTQKDNTAKKTLRWISGLSLLLTLIFLVANVTSALAGEALGNVLHIFLVLVSVPMICSHQWFLSLLVWACIFFVTLGRKRK